MDLAIGYRAHKYVEWQKQTLVNFFWSFRTAHIQCSRISQLQKQLFNVKIYSDRSNCIWTQLGLYCVCVACVFAAFDQTCIHFERYVDI